MAMVGAIILARREYLPEQIVPSDLPQTVLTLPERPRELVPAGSDKQE
jgi:NAD(P)H-quinone oxidoreductase subunit 6